MHLWRKIIINWWVMGKTDPAELLKLEFLGLVHPFAVGYNMGTIDSSR
jgi:hypothetical protein